MPRRNRNNNKPKNTVSKFIDDAFNIARSAVKGITGFKRKKNNSNRNGGFPKIGNKQVIRKFIKANHVKTRNVFLEYKDEIAVNPTTQILQFTSSNTPVISLFNDPAEESYGQLHSIEGLIAYKPIAVKIELFGMPTPIEYTPTGQNITKSKVMPKVYFTIFNDVIGTDSYPINNTPTFSWDCTRKYACFQLTYKSCCKGLKTLDDWINPSIPPEDINLMLSQNGTYPYPNISGDYVITRVGITYKFKVMYRDTAPDSSNTKINHVVKKNEHVVPYDSKYSKLANDWKHLTRAQKKKFRKDIYDIDQDVDRIFSPENAFSEDEDEKDVNTLENKIISDNAEAKSSTC